MSIHFTILFAFLVSTLSCSEKNSVLAPSKGCISLNYVQLLEYLSSIPLIFRFDIKRKGISNKTLIIKSEEINIMTGHFYSCFAT
jgi:hypothetical protein